MLLLCRHFTALIAFPATKTWNQEMKQTVNKTLLDLSQYYTRPQCLAGMWHKVTPMLQQDPPFILGSAISYLVLNTWYAHHHFLTEREWLAVLLDRELNQNLKTRHVHLLKLGNALDLMRERNVYFPDWIYACAVLAWTQKSVREMSSYSVMACLKKVATFESPFQSKIWLKALIYFEEKLFNDRKLSQNLYSGQDWQQLKWVAENLMRHSQSNESENDILNALIQPLADASVVMLKRDVHLYATEAKRLMGEIENIFNQTKLQATPVLANSLAHACVLLDDDCFIPFLSSFQGASALNLAPRLLFSSNPTFSALGESFITKYSQNELDWIQPMLASQMHHVARGHDCPLESRLKLLKPFPVHIESRIVNTWIERMLLDNKVHQCGVLRAMQKRIFTRGLPRGLLEAEKLETEMFCQALSQLGFSAAIVGPIHYALTRFDFMMPWLLTLVKHPKMKATLPLLNFLLFHLDRPMANFISDKQAALLKFKIISQCIKWVKLDNSFEKSVIKRLYAKQCVQLEKIEIAEEWDQLALVPHQWQKLNRMKNECPEFISKCQSILNVWPK